MSRPAVSGILTIVLAMQFFRVTCVVMLAPILIDKEKGPFFE